MHEVKGDIEAFCRCRQATCALSGQKKAMLLCKHVRNQIATIHHTACQSIKLTVQCVKNG